MCGATYKHGGSPVHLLEAGGCRVHQHSSKLLQHLFLHTLLGRNSQFRRRKYIQNQPQGGFNLQQLSQSAI